MKTKALVVRWSEPTDGIAVYGPFAEWKDERIIWGMARRDFLNEGELPGDVDWDFVPLLSHPLAVS